MCCPYVFWMEQNTVYITTNANMAHCHSAEKKTVSIYSIGQTLADPRVSWIMICLNWNDPESRAHQLKMPPKQVVDTYFCQIISKWYIRPSNVCANLHSLKNSTLGIQDMSDIIITIRLDLRKLKINRCTSNWLSWARTMYAQEFHLTRILNHQA